MRSKKAVINILISFLLQVTAVICGLIIPKLIIENYGSNVNGMIMSITQFLSFIVLLEAGVGGVVRAALYRPLALKDSNSISRIIRATESFFRIIAIVFLLYIVLLAIFFPTIVNVEFEKLFTGSLVLIIGISTFFQYYFGLTYQILLQADQKQYISSIIQIFTLILNTILVVLLITNGASILYVKLGTAFIFIIRPIFLSIYIRKKYNINKQVLPDNKAIEKRWDGLGHHVAFLLHTSTDIVILTLFSNLKEISVYSIYYLVSSSVKKITVTFASSIEAAFGDIIAKNEKEVLRRNFSVFEFSIFFITTLIFSSTALLILPFVELYTSNVADADYYRPYFAFILLAAEVVFCLRVPYSAVVLAAGHFKETRNGAFIEAAINVTISIILVNFLGIIGVAIGTLCAMVYRTIEYVMYLSKNIIERNMKEFFKKVLVFSLGSIITFLVMSSFPTIDIVSFKLWIYYATLVVFISLIVITLTSIIFFKTELNILKQIISRLLKNKNTYN